MQRPSRSSTPLSDIQLLGRLIGIDTTAGRPNAALIDFVTEYLADAGCVVKRFPAGDQSYNLVARIGPDAPGGLLLSGHVDTVPATEPAWESNPFELVERGGRLYGRGTTDMKGFVALAVNQLTAAAPSALREPLTLLLSSDEELGSLGMQRFARDWTGDPILPCSAIIGEPTQLRVVRMHKGHLKVHFRVRGKAAHSGLPHLGANAIELALPLLAALSRLAAETHAERTETSVYFPECPYPAVNIARVDGGGAINVIPESCRVSIGIRLLPGQRANQCLERLHRLMDDLPPATRNATELIDSADNPPMLCDADRPINREVSQLLGQSETIGVSFASDAGWLQHMGVDCVLFGPGCMDDAHHANESIDIQQLVAARDWLERFVNRFCVEGVKS